LDKLEVVRQLKLLNIYMSAGLQREEKLAALSPEELLP
jgi:hypothetical protein